MKIILLIVFLQILPNAPNTDYEYHKRIQSINGQFLLPVASNILSSDSQMHLNRGSVHAWDLTQPFGSLVYPIADGDVLYAGCNNAGGYGCWILTAHANGYRSIMAHCIEGSLMVRSGDTVKQNQPVCKTGRTGMTSFGPHTHLEVSQNGVRINPATLFDIKLMSYEPFRNISGIPWAANGTVTAKNSYLSTQTISTSTILWMFVLVGFTLVIYLLYSPKRYVYQLASHGAMIIIVFLLPLQVMAMPVTMNESYSIPNSQQWDYVYKFMRSWEGARCVHDPVRTLKGITQGTYNRYRMEQGLSGADVCTSLTERQAKDIYYRYYYLASGANKLPTRIALQQFDFAVNAGTGAAKRAYATCGNDFNCYTRYRVSFYQSAKLCYLYCKAWINRVNDLQRYASKIK